MTDRFTDKIILHVEDLEDNRGIVRQLVSRLGAQLVEAADGQEGVRLARQLRPDLILMDLSLPIMNGWDATKLLKASPDTASIPVVALTAHAMAGDQQLARQAGCDGYVAKPVDPTSFLGYLRDCLSGALLR